MSLDVSQARDLVKKMKRVSKIDFSHVKEIADESIKKQAELAGNWTTKVVNDTLQVDIKNILSGKVDEVSIPTTGWTFHTHPRGCPSLDNCSIIPPSSDDMAIFAERYDDTHMVISEKRVYWIQAKRYYDPVEVELIYDFYAILENFFDNNDIPHSTFDKIFTLSSKYGDFFTIYKFKNKKIATLD